MFRLFMVLIIVSFSCASENKVFLDKAQEMAKSSKVFILNFAIDELYKHVDIDMKESFIKGVVIHDHFMNEIILSSFKDANGLIVHRHGLPEFIKNFPNVSVDIVQEKSYDKTVLATLHLYYDLEGFKKSNNKIIELSLKEKEYLHVKEKIKFCVNPDWYPLEAIEKKTHVGISADFFKLFKDKIPVSFELVKTKNWEESLQFVKEKKCDVLPLAMKTKERENYLNFTTSYLNIPLVIATKKDIPFIQSLNNLKDEKVGIVKKLAFEEFILKNYPNINIKSVDNAEDGLGKIENGELFGFIDALTSISYQFQKNPTKDIKVSGRFKEDWKFSVAVNNDDTILLGIFEKIITQVKTGERQKILNKYISVTYEKGINYTLIFQIISFALLVIVVILVWNRKIQKEKEKLDALYKELKEKDELLIIKSRHAAMGEMIAMIAHQWRQPLATISMDINNILLDINLGEADVNDIEKIASTVNKRLQYLSNTIEDFGDFFKPNKSLVEIYPKEIIDETMSIIGKSLENDDIKVNIIDDSKNKIQVYQRELMQVLINILTNAKDALMKNRINESKIIDIFIKENEQKISISICDNGGGIDKDSINHIFEPYFSTKNEKNGVGLGLYMSLVIINKHLFGNLFCENKEFGACFTIELPNALHVKI